MSAPTACPECLRRSHLLALLAPYVERYYRPGVDVSRLLALDDVRLTQTVAPAVSRQILARIGALGEGQLREQLDDATWASCRHDSLYPAPLRDCSAAPAAIFGRGDSARLGWLASASAAATVVGSRRATSYGRETARDLGHSLTGAGVTVVSGLAFGVDGCAHRGALDAGGQTVAVIGRGVDGCYPAAHRSLWRRISEDGLVLSELPPGATPWRWTFPARNRILAALSGITVVVEAASRSGSLITADFARACGRRLGAVPGPVSSRASAGPNALLADGAALVRGAEDVLRALQRPSANPAPDRSAHPDTETPQHG